MNDLAGRKKKKQPARSYQRLQTISSSTLWGRGKSLEGAGKGWLWGRSYPSSGPYGASTAHSLHHQPLIHPIRHYPDAASKPFAVLPGHHGFSSNNRVTPSGVERVLMEGVWWSGAPESYRTLAPQVPLTPTLTNAPLGPWLGCEAGAR